MNYSIIKEIPVEYIEPIVFACKNINWENSIYDQPITSAALAGGKTLEYPFIKRHPATIDKIYLDEEKGVLNSSFSLFKWLEENFKDIIFVRAEIATLLPKTGIAWHTDNRRKFFTICNRIHIPLITNDECFQLWEDESVNFKVGYIYSYNNQKRHSAVNNGNTIRSTIIIDYVLPSQWDVLVAEGEVNSFLDKPKGKARLI